MAQSDQTVQNATFPSVRADINDNLAALFSQSSGNSAPAVTVAFQDWIDTSGASPLWKKRNAANNAWITLGTISASTIAFEGTLPSQSGNADKYLSTDGTVASWKTVASGINDIKIFTSSGNWTCPAGVLKAYVAVVGGGGGGAAGASTSFYGGQGGYAGVGIGLLTVTPGTSYSITVGAAGAGANSGNGGAGGSSSFSSNITATGGGGGAAATTGGYGTDGTSGSCVSVDANIRKRNIYGDGVTFLEGDYFKSDNVTTPLAWSIDRDFCPGAAGSGEFGSSGNNASAGAGGAVAIWY